MQVQREMSGKDGPGVLDSYLLWCASLDDGRRRLTASTTVAAALALLFV
jgi:hypothetical protein